MCKNQPHHMNNTFNVSKTEKKQEKVMSPQTKPLQKSPAAGKDTVERWLLCVIISSTRSHKMIKAEEAQSQGTHSVPEKYPFGHLPQYPLWGYQLYDIFTRGNSES